jgi:lysophospholipase L1-like esterase
VFTYSTLGAVETHGHRYLRFAALGDSTTFGLGDPVAGGWRGWARLLAEAFAASAYDVSFCNLATPGATAGSVLRDQLTDAVAHRPDLAALVVGVNDALKSTWNAGRVRDELLTCADALTADGATLLTARFHDHAAVLPLPSPLRRPLRNRIDQLNAAWDDVHAAYGGLRIDLAARPETLDRPFWSVDRMHPSELGHRCLARAFAAELQAAGVDLEPPSAEPAGGIPPNWRRDALWILAEGAPWIGRRARDLGPWAARLAWQEIRPAREGVGGRRWSKAGFCTCTGETPGSGRLRAPDPWAEPGVRHHSRR